MAKLTPVQQNLIEALVAYYKTCLEKFKDTKQARKQTVIDVEYILSINSNFDPIEDLK